MSTASRFNLSRLTSSYQSTGNNSKTSSSLPSHGGTTSATTSHNTSNKSIVPRRSVSRRSLFSTSSFSLSRGTSLITSNGSGNGGNQDLWEIEWRNGPPNTYGGNIELIGQGTFGTVYRTKCPNTEEIVAIKRVLHNPQYKMRELEIMQRLQEVRHPNIIRLKHHFYNKSSNVNPTPDIYLHLVMDYIPETLASMIAHWNRNKLQQQQQQQQKKALKGSCHGNGSGSETERRDPTFESKNNEDTFTTTNGCGIGEDSSFPFMLASIYMFQLCRGLAHLHGLGIAHRDIKPQNILIDPHRNILKICDFGSAKTLLQGETHLAYICSRYYRAPELILASKEKSLYDYSIDIWAAGCVFAEIYLGRPLFPGISAADQIIEIANVLGNPSSYQLHAMDPEQKAVFRFPTMPGRSLESVLPPSLCSLEMIDLLKQFVCYNPHERIHMINACSHTFFQRFRENISTLLEHQVVSMDICCFCPEELIYASEETTDILMIFSNVGRMCL